LARTEHRVSKHQARWQKKKNDMFRRSRIRPSIAFVAAGVVCLFVFLAAAANARVTYGANAGTRGLRTMSVPPTTRATPKPPAQIDRSAMQMGQTSSAARSTSAPANSVLSRPGLLGGFAAGFLGAGLIGLFAGHGLAGGLGGIASIMGLILQLVLVVLVARIVWMWWRRRQTPAFAGLSPRELADVYGRPRSEGFGRGIDAGAPSVSPDQRRS
jgi:Flp pilus assembly protein protease CpaA